MNAPAVARADLVLRKARLTVRMADGSPVVTITPPEGIQVGPYAFSAIVLDEIGPKEARAWMDQLERILEGG